MVIDLSVYVNIHFRYSQFMRRTKIVCTIGPATSSKEMIKKLALTGMNVARLNFSHGTHAEHGKVIQSIKEVRRELQIPLAIMLDTKGPEIRTGCKEKIAVHSKQQLRLVKVAERSNDIPIRPSFVIDQLKKNMPVLIDDGYIQGHIVEKGEDYALLEIFNEGTISPNKTLIFPGQTIKLPDLTEQDIKDIEFGCKEGVDLIAASFVNNAKQMTVIKELIASFKKPHILAIAKIESRSGVDNFDAILQIADGIMVARGDLGLEFPVSCVPPLQKKMIAECNRKAKFVITATQMLESMIHNPSPTRAEASDVANAIYDATSAVMLSGETAVGMYPLQAVKMMEEIILEAEKDFNYAEYFLRKNNFSNRDIPSAVVFAAVNTSYQIQAKAIIVYSNAGNTIRRISRHHPQANIIVVTPSEDTFHQTSVLWGTKAIMEKNANVEQGLTDITCFALQKKWVKYGDPIVITMGKPYGISFTTNTLMVESVGNVLVRGLPMEEAIDPMIGEVFLLLSHESRQDEDLSDKIVVTTRILDRDLARLQKVKAIILQNHPLDDESEKHLKELYKTHRIPFIVQADAATSLLKDKSQIRFHPSMGLVFKADSLTEKQMLSRLL